MERILKPINDQIKTLTDACSKRLNAVENFDQDLRTVTLTHGVPIEINTGVKDRVLGCILLACPRRTESLVFFRVSDKVARVTANFLPAAPGEETEAVLLFFGG